VVGFRRTHLLKFRSFCSLRKPSADDSILLIVEVYYSHTKSFDVVDKVRKHSVALVILQPHSTHIMQPLDVVMYKKIKKWLGSSPGWIVKAFLSVQVVRDCLQKSSNHGSFSKLVYKNWTLSL
jgi:hypothetical protein